MFVAVIKDENENAYSEDMIDVDDYEEEGEKDVENENAGNSNENPFKYEIRRKRRNGPISHSSVRQWLQKEFTRR